MVNSEFSKDLNKYLDKQNVSSELSPGSPRRYEPKEGIYKHNEKIHKDSEYADKYKKLPFSFSKPYKPKKTVIKVCSKCGSHVFVPKNSIGIICRHCKQYASLLEV